MLLFIILTSNCAWLVENPLKRRKMLRRNAMEIVGESIIVLYVLDGRNEESFNERGWEESPAKYIWHL
jgi:hypothetical protein